MAPMPGPRRTRSLTVAIVTALALVAACGSGTEIQPVATGDPAPTATAVPEAGSGDDTDEQEVDAAEVPTPSPVLDLEPASTPEPELSSVRLQAGANQLLVFSDPGQVFTMVDSAGTEHSGETDTQGALLWRDIAAGEAEVTWPNADKILGADVADFTDPPPDANFYSGQEIGEGFGYVVTRDGTTLSATVWLPPGGDGPYPTVVEYSGYGPSNPGDSTFAQLFNTLGYAYVGVNMRGTGCSGGSFEFFEPSQLLDGYDVIEAIAAQPWVFDNEVGMVGISYPGISQLFVASTQPPSLAAITPLSVLDDSTKSTLAPGGILNTGFAGNWSDERESDSQPYGQGWEQGIVDGGDTMCADNQLVRLQNTSASELIEANPYYTAELGDPIAPTLLVDDITVPVFLAGAWQDEQTGGHFPAMLDNFTSSPHVYATMVNGSHTESIANLAIFERYAEFLELYVAKRTPNLGSAEFIAPILASSLTGVEGLALPTGNRFDGLSYDEALAAYEAEPHIRILFEDGAAEGQAPGAPLPRYEASFDSWPIPEAQTRTWFLGPQGTLTDQAPAEAGTTPSSYVSDPANTNATFYEGGSGGIWAADVVYDWQPIPAGSGVGFSTAALAADTTVIGFGSLDLWLQSSAEDTDLEVTITEIRADGSEVYVQSGWLRASHRALDEAASLPNQPIHTHLEADAAPLPAGEFTEVRVEIFPFAHAFRAGSQIRVTVDAPGGARPLWAFPTTIAAGETNEIAHDAENPSKLVLTVVEGIDVPATPPACGALRSQPCRTFEPLENETGS